MTALSDSLLSRLITLTMRAPIYREDNIIGMVKHIRLFKGCIHVNNKHAKEHVPQNRSSRYTLINTSTEPSAVFIGNCIASSLVAFTPITYALHLLGKRPVKALAWYQLLSYLSRARCRFPFKSINTVFCKM